MKISLTKTGKRYNRDWIFRNLSYEFVSGNSYAITGPNGSGKSTLLQAIGGALMLSEGSVSYEMVSSESMVYSSFNSESLSKTQQSKPQTINHKQNIHPDNVFQHLSIAAPYLELIEEMTVKEFLEFHAQFKPFLSNISIEEIINLVGLKSAANKQIRYYSSGMKQRVKLAQAIFSDVSLILLDEPCTNLDSEGVALYQSLINKYCGDRLVVVSSNDVNEYGFCKEKLNIIDYKVS